MVPWSLVCPASRGIGFALARRILQSTNVPVVATARKEAEKTKKELLDGLEVDEQRLTMVHVDVLDEGTIAEAAVFCKETFPTLSNANHLHLAFIVPGVLFPEKSPMQINADDALLTLRTNTLGPMLMLKHFAQFLPRKTATISTSDSAYTNLPPRSTTAVMSARVGSISDNRLGGWYSYRASKAGVNQVVKTFDNHLRTVSGDNALAIALHPGTVKTRLSQEFWNSVKREKLFEREWVAEQLLDVVMNFGLQGRGRCWDWAGKEVPP